MLCLDRNLIYQLAFVLSFSVPLTAFADEPAQAKLKPPALNDKAAVQQPEASALARAKTCESKSAQVVSASQCCDLIETGGVFIFFDPSCPICAEYFPTIERLNAKYSGQVQFYFVFNRAAAKSAQKFIDDYHPHCSVLLDSDALLQSKLGARVTPQVFLLSAKKTEYCGRIDDRYESIGHRRSIIRSNDLENALQVVCAGKSPQLKVTEPIGCFIQIDQ